MQINDAFHLAEQIENVAAEIYEALALQMDSPLFEQLAREERQHARRVQMLRVRVIQSPSSFASVQLDRDRMEALLERARGVSRQIKAEPPADLSDAKRMMVELEEELAAAHAESIGETDDPTVRELFEILVRQDRAHAELLGG